jgi:hypothetical protein
LTLPLWKRFCQRCPQMLQQASVRFSRLVEVIKQSPFFSVVGHHHDLPFTPSSCAAYKPLKNLKALQTSSTFQLDDVLQLTRLKLHHTMTSLNLNMLATQLPDLRCLEGLPYRSTNEPENYWPLRQCHNLEKLIMHSGCAATPWFLQCCFQSRLTEVLQNQVGMGAVPDGACHRVLQ